MESPLLKSASIDELWRLYEQVNSALVRRIPEETARLDERLRRLEYSGGAISPNWARRPYPLDLLDLRLTWS
jgi:hypothetical protein